MFTEIHKLIDERNYDDAVATLLQIYNGENAKTVAYAGYLLGYLNTRHDYKSKNTVQARKYLRENMYGDYPHPYAYVLYSRIEEDYNIALNYLNKGLERFPKDARILDELLKMAPDKDAIIGLIRDSGLTNPELMGSVIQHLIRERQWKCIGEFILRIESTGNLEDEEQLYLELIRAYAYMFQDNPEYKKAQAILEEIIAKDVDNQFCYAHYLGLIYSFINQGNTAMAISYFDRLPVNNSIMDFDDGPWPFGVYIDFKEIYRTIFDAIANVFDHSDSRKLKARVLYALYLYHPSETVDVYRYKKSDAAILTRYLKTEFNPKVAGALYNMRTHFKQFKEAYDVLWCFLKEHESLVDNWVFVGDILRSTDKERLEMLVEQTVMYLKEDDYDKASFVDEVFFEVLERLHKYEMHSRIREIADFFSNDEIIRCGGTFICAYAFGEIDSARATILYEKLVEREPRNAAAINNLGVRYREKGDLYKALLCYERASCLDSGEELYKNNLRIIQKNIQKQTEEEIESISNSISMNALQAIGYTVDLCKRIISIQNSELRDIIQRDLRECAIAVVAGQDKLATIMCGSIVEALLLYRIGENGITKYDVSSVSPRKDALNRLVSDMVLNELLYVALKENILDKADHNLSHYLKDYRNMVHPAREIRTKETVSHENVVTMWSVLVRLISVIFPD